MVIVAEWSNALGCGPSIRKDFVGSNPIFHPNIALYRAKLITWIFVKVLKMRFQNPPAQQHCDVPMESYMLYTRSWSLKTWVQIPPSQLGPLTQLVRVSDS